jgi:biopolymer transport protein ExbD
MAGGGASVKSEKKKARIEIIPLIDVVFFLLATFVLFTLSLDKIQSVPIELPKAAPPSAKVEDPPLILQVTDGNSVFFDREPISMEEVEPRLHQYISGNKNPRVLVTGDDRAKFGPTIQVLDKVRSAGIQQVSIETIPRATGK